jgi:hypothetical protein
MVCGRDTGSNYIACDACHKKRNNEKKVAELYTGDGGALSELFAALLRSLN